jgi:hypothetical protein
VRNGFRIHPHLAKSHADPKRHISLGEPTAPEQVSGFDEGEPLHQTRPFSKVQMEGKWSGRHLNHAIPFMAQLRVATERLRDVDFGGMPSELFG